MYAKVYIFYKTKPCQIFLFCPTENSSKTENFLLGKIQCKTKQFVITFCNPYKIVPPLEWLGIAGSSARSDWKWSLGHHPRSVKSEGPSLESRIHRHVGPSFLEAATNGRRRKRPTYSKIQVLVRRRQSDSAGGEYPISSPSFFVVSAFVRLRRHLACPSPRIPHRPMPMDALFLHFRINQATSSTFYPSSVKTFGEDTT
jgi:hypothetical protein